MFSNMGQSNPEDLGNGGTIDGNIVITGDLQVNGGGSLSFDEIIEGTQVIDVNSTEALLVRKNGDGGDIFIVDTTNSKVNINGGTTITTADNTDTLTLVSTDADNNAGAYLNIYRNSASPADNDQIGQITFTGRNDNSQDVDYARIITQIKDASDGSELGRFAINTMVAGGMYSRINVMPTETVFNDESVDLDFRVESDANTHAFFLEGSSGNVGIGIDSPSAKIHSTGTILIDQSAGTSNSAVLRLEAARGSADQDSGEIRFYNQGGSDHDYARIVGVRGGATNSGYLQFRTSEVGSEVTGMTISSTGDVQLQERLTFSGTNNTSAAATINLNSNNYLYIAGGTAGLIIGDDALATAIQFNDASSMAFDIGGGTRARLDANSRISLSNNDSGTSNTVFGSIAGDDLASGGNYNSFFGHNSGHAVTTGDYNTAIGLNALDTATVPARVTAIGTASMRGAVTADAIGTVAVGYASLNVLTSGRSNSALGYETLQSNTTGEYNTAIGSESLRTNIDGDHNTALGYASLYSFEAGSDGDGNNVAIGSNASFHLDSGTNNTMVGTSAGFGVAGTITYSNNVGIGTNSLLAITTGGQNVTVGKNSGDSITDGGYNTFIGYYAGATTTSVTRAVAIGTEAMESGNVTNDAEGTIAIGSKALHDLTSGAGNVAVGYEALDAEDAGGRSTAVGYQALSAQNNDTGSNTAVGWSAGDLIVAGYANTLLGAESGTTGTNDLTSGIQNTLIGQATAVSADSTPTNQTVLGRGATGQANNSVTLGNASVTAVYMASDSGAIVHCSGVNFPDTQVASADANVLDDYEEGTYAITLGNGGTGATYSTSTNIGTYTKIGQVVHVNARVIASENHSGGDGYLFMSLPFGHTANEFFRVFVFYNNLGTAGDSVVGVPATSSSGGTQLHFQYLTKNASPTTINSSALSSGDEISFQVTYRVA